MQGRYPAIIGPAHHQAADIDDEGLRGNEHVNPFAGAGVDLEASRLIFAKYRALNHVGRRR